LFGGNPDQARGSFKIHSLFSKEVQMLVNVGSKQYDTRELQELVGKQATQQHGTGIMLLGVYLVPGGRVLVVTDSVWQRGQSGECIGVTAHFADQGEIADLADRYGGALVNLVERETAKDHLCNGGQTSTPCPAALGKLNHLTGRELTTWTGVITCDHCGGQWRGDFFTLQRWADDTSAFGWRAECFGNATADGDGLEG
jgi:hypothetical protein